MESRNQISDFKNIKKSKLSQARKEIIELSRSNYEAVGDYLTERKKHIVKIPNKQLGNVSEEEEYYFQETPEANLHTHYFLSRFYSDSKNINGMIAQHHSKYNETTKTKPLMASCFNFVVISVQESSSGVPKKYCLIAISGDTQYGLATEKLIAPTISQCNKDQQDVEYVYISGDVQNFNNLLHRLGAPYSGVFKPCAEKFIGSVIFKLCSIFKDNFKILGGYNCGTYPFLRGENYGFEGSADKTVVPPIRENKMFQLENDIQIDVIPCCSNCVDNKDAMFTSWKGVKDYNKQSESPPSSPLINSVMTPNTFKKSITAYSYNARRQRSEEYTRKQEEKEVRIRDDEEGGWIVNRRRTQRSQQRNVSILEVAELTTSEVDMADNESQTSVHKPKVDEFNYKGKNTAINSPELPHIQDYNLPTQPVLNSEKNYNQKIPANVATTRKVITTLKKTTIEEITAEGIVVKKQVTENLKTEEYVINTPNTKDLNPSQTHSSKRKRKNKSKEKKKSEQDVRSEMTFKGFLFNNRKIVSIVSALSVAGLFATYKAITSSGSQSFSLHHYFSN